MSSLSLRRRGVWEAADSGLILWRNNFVCFIPLFAIPVWIIACGLRLLPSVLRPGNFYLLSYVVLWWLKPLFDRLVLHIISVRFFAESEPSQLKDLHRGLFKTIRRGLLGDLLWRRFSPARAARMPIRVLEHMGGKHFTLRKAALGSGGLNFCSFISGLGLGLEFMLLLGEALFFIIIIQMFSPAVLTYVQNNLEAMEIFIFIAFCFNYILVESLYVCMGFGLYINSRVEVEGWDLQLLFQKFAGAVTSHIKVIVFVCLFLLQLFAPTLKTAYAEEDIEYFPEGFPAISMESLEEIREIAASDDFGYFRDGWEIKFKKSTDDWEMPDLELVPWAENLKRIFGVVLRILVILASIGFLGFAVFWFLKFRRNSQRRNSPVREGKSRKGENDFKNLLSSDESPQELFAKSENFYNSGFLRETWASCLAGCLGAFSQYCSVQFPVDATEYGCLRLVCEALPGEDEKFGELVQNWILFVYGGRTPERESFERALAYGRSIGVSDEP